MPGLDASICPECRLVWNSRPFAPPPAQASEVFTGPLATVAIASSPPARKVPRTIPDQPEFEYAITLKRPWAHAIAHMNKRIENRTWRCHLKPGSWLAIHAGRSYVFDDADWIEDRFQVQLPEPADQPTGIVAIAQFLGNVTESDSPWFGGPVGWQLGEVKTLAEAVDCKGRQGLWRVDQGVKEAVYRALAVPF